MKASRTPRPSPPRRRAAALVETAMCLPVLLLLVLGMLEVGRAVMVSQRLTHAARHGARAAAVSGGTTAAARAAVADAVSGAGLSGAEVTVSVAGTEGEAARARRGEPISVAVSVRYADVAWLAAPVYLEGATLKAEAVMRRE